MLEIKNLHAEVDGNEILKGVDLKINPESVSSKTASLGFKTAS